MGTMVRRTTSLLAALLLLVGCTSPAPPPSPTRRAAPVSPSASPAAVDTTHPTEPVAPASTPTSLPAPSASLALSPLPSAGNPSLPPAASLTVARGLHFAISQPFAKNAVQSVYQLANWGSTVVYVELNGPTGDFQQVKLVDLTKPDLRPELVYDGSKHGEQVQFPAINATTIAWVSFSSDSDGLHWQITRRDRASGTNSTIAEGTNVHRSAGAGLPVIALDGNEIAYNTQAKWQGQGDPVDIHVVDMTTGEELRTIESDGYIWDVALADESVLFSAAHDVADDGQLIDTQVMFARSDGQSFDLGPNGWEVSMDGPRLVWVQRASDATGDSAAQFQVTMTALADDPSPRVVSHAYHQPDCPPMCAVVGSRWAVAEDGIVAWHEGDTVGDHLVAWDAASGAAMDLGLEGSTFLSSAGGGWLVTSTALNDQPNLGQQFLGATIASIEASLAAQ
jgi:hypothetical protein